MDTEDAAPPPGLSSLEARCLCKRIDECTEALQHAVLGAGEACLKDSRAAWLVQICGALAAAEQQLELARTIARAHPLTHAQAQELGGAAA